MFTRNFSLKNVVLASGSYGSCFGYVCFGDDGDSDVVERFIDGYSFTGKDDDADDEGDHELNYDEVTELKSLFDSSVADWAASNGIEGKGFVTLDGSVVATGATK